MNAITAKFIIKYVTNPILTAIDGNDNNPPPKVEFKKVKLINIHKYFLFTYFDFSVYISSFSLIMSSLS